MLNIGKHLSSQPYFKLENENGDIKQSHKGVISVFDFDGTLFRSPAPSPSINEKDKKRLLQPVFANGLGWFQNTRTLSTPYIDTNFYNLINLINKNEEENEKEKEATTKTYPGDVECNKSPENINAQITNETTSNKCLPSLVDPNNPHRSLISEWFILPIVDKLIEAKRRGDVVCIMTGREEFFRQRIGELIAIAELTSYVDHLFLKPDPRGGTVQYKVNSFLVLCKHYRPERLIYYEDREDQGRRIQIDTEKMLMRHFGVNGPRSSSGLYDNKNNNESPNDSKSNDSMVSFVMIMVDAKIQKATLLLKDAENQLLSQLQEDADRLLSKRKEKRYHYNSHRS